MVKRATQVEQDILDGAIERAVQDLASRSGKSAEEIRQMATTGALFVHGGMPGYGADELNRGLTFLREAMDGSPREYWLMWYREDGNADTLGRKHRRVHRA